MFTYLCHGMQQRFPRSSRSSLHSSLHAFPADLSWYISAVPCRAVLCCAVLCCAVLCCAVLCCAVLCCAVLCCAVLCRAVLCCAVNWSSAISATRSRWDSFHLLLQATLLPSLLSLTNFAKNNSLGSFTSHNLADVSTLSSIPGEELIPGMDPKARGEEGK